MPYPFKQIAWSAEGFAILWSETLADAVERMSSRKKRQQAGLPCSRLALGSLVCFGTVTCLSTFRFLDANSLAEPPKPDDQIARGQLFFLFLLDDHLPHSDVWKAFFGPKRQQSGFRAFAHCVDADICIGQDVFDGLGIDLVETVPTAYCKDLVTVTWQLIRAAISSEPADSDRVQKFIVISNSTLPLQPMRWMREKLLKNDNSELCYSKRSEWVNKSVLGVRYSIVKHHQWVVLNRADASNFVHGWDLRPGGKKVATHPAEDWMLPRMGSDGKANFSSLVQRSRVGPQRCPDEEVMSAMLYGLYEPGKERFWDRILQRNICRTYVNWNIKKTKPPEVFHHVDDRLRSLMHNESDDSPLFARKFVDTADVRELIPHVRRKNTDQ